MQTKQKILLESLHLFARKGFDAVSVREIVAQLKLTPGALYRHYPSKRAIFESILRRMEADDLERAKLFEVPEGTFSEMAEAYRKTPLAKICDFCEAQFRYWTEDEFASAFRKMLTLEQFRSSEMTALYQNYLAGGVLQYVEDLFREMGSAGLLKPEEPNLLALEFYAPVFALMSVFDAASPEAREAVRLCVHRHLERFARLHGLE